MSWGGGGILPLFIINRVEKDKLLTLNLYSYPVKKA